MGYTDFTKKQVVKAIGYTLPCPRQRVVELGAQNDHTKRPPMPYMNEWFKKNGFDEYECIDLNGENNAKPWNLGINLGIADRSFDLVTNIGTFEHVSGFDGKFSLEASYNCWLNMFNLLLPHGIIYSESPQTGSWPGHGVAYLTTEFIYQLCEHSDLQLLDIGVHAACHNTRNGWNVWCILRKTGDKFPTLEQFKTFDLRLS